MTRRFANLSINTAALRRKHWDASHLAAASPFESQATLAAMRPAHAVRRAGKLYRPSLETRTLAHTSATPNTASASV